MNGMTVTIEELKPVIDLISQQEERLCHKIDEAKEATLEHIDLNLKSVTREMGGIRRELKSHNGRLTKVEERQIAQVSICQERKLTCGTAMDKMIVATDVTLFIGWIKRNWKLSIILSIFIIILLQALVMEGVEHKWIGTLISFFKP